MRVLVCDDQVDRCNDIVRNVSEAGIRDITVLVGPDLTKELHGLFQHVSAFLDRPGEVSNRARGPFDEADVLLIDNNLAHLEVAGARLTAESIAGYIRAFTDAGYIVSLNKNPDVDFDLRYLVGDYETRADLALNTDHLAVPALWGRQNKQENRFSPWYWPSLSAVAEKRRHQITFVRDRLDASVMDSLAFRDEDLEHLSLHARGALSSEADMDAGPDRGISLRRLTYRDVFVSKGRSLPSKAERLRISEAATPGNAMARAILARVVAADLDLWFRRDVLGPQEPLIDVPHLLVKFPFLLGSSVGNLRAWNSAAQSIDEPYALDPNLYRAHLSGAKFAQEIWVPRPCFWWPRLKSDMQLNERFQGATSAEWPDVAFCEDRSLFLNRTAEEAGSLIEFPAEFEGSWTRRYVSMIDGIRYSPRSRLAA